MALGVTDYIMRLTRAYLLVLAVIGLISISCYSFIQNKRQQASELASVINIAGRQRMLSQKIVKAAHYVAEERVLVVAARTELRDALLSWSSTHNDLRLGINPETGNKVSLSIGNLRLFDQIDQSYEGIYEQAQRIVSTELEMDQLSQSLSILRVSERRFLMIMDQIVDEFEQQASALFSSARTLNNFVIIVTWLSLCTVPFVVFRPVLNKPLGGLIEDNQRVSEDEEKAEQETDFMQRFFLSNAAFDVLMNSLPLMVYIKDHSLTLSKCNDRFADFIGLENSQSIVGLHHWELPDSACGITESLDEDRDIFEGSLDILDQERSHRDSLGKSHDFLVSKIVLHDEQGNPSSLMGVYVDVSEHRRLEGQLELTGKLEAMGQLSAGVAHEINTPLQYISDNTTFVQEELGSLLDLVNKSKQLVNPETGDRENVVKEYGTELEKVDIDFLADELPAAIEQSMQGIESVKKIVLSMKEFSHPGDEDIEDTDINHVILSSITLTINQWKYIAELKEDMAQDLPLIKCNSGKLSQVIVNLIVNASHAVADKVAILKREGNDNAKGEIGIITSRTKKGVEIRISDTGTGIPYAAREKIFEPFFTTKEVGKGTGQGLAISHKIITQDYGGSLRFETSLGRGTTFIIELPVNKGSILSAA